MEDDTERIISMNGGVFPLGVDEGGSGRGAAFEFVPSPLVAGKTQEPDKSLLPVLEDASETNPSTLKILPAEFQFTSYEWSEEDQEAYWTANIFAEGVNLEGSDALVSVGSETPIEIAVG